jgi:ankyrin repeat protein
MSLIFIMYSIGANQHHTESDGWTALHFAASNGHKDTCEFLLKNQCDAKGVTESGRCDLELGWG